MNDDKLKEMAKEFRRGNSHLNFKHVDEWLIAFGETLIRAAAEIVENCATAHKDSANLIREHFGLEAE